jgi:Rad3-related DNA helicase
LEVPAEPSFSVAVRALCEFSAKAGDLDLRFTPAPTAEQGMEGHRVVADRRPAHVERELAVEGHCHGLQLRGRIDLFDPRAGRLEEVKTHRGPVDRVPDNHRALHWAQAQAYGALLCAQRGLGELTVALVYYDIDTQRETAFDRHCTAAELQQALQALCARFAAWAQEEVAHRGRRDAALQALAWPFEQFPPGQRDLATAAYNAARSGRCLLAQAPTGSGKTMGTLFPLLKAMPGQRLDKLFFLTAKTSGRQLALDALARLRAQQAPLPVRVVELVARDKACEHPDKACHGESCPLAQGFYDRLPAAREAARDHAQDKQTLRELALQHRVCPYYLGQEMARWADVVVGDYNHYFDLSALLHGSAQSQGWRAALLVDEAHNLVDRARAMYTAALDPVQFRVLRRRAPPALKPAFKRLGRAWSAMAQTTEAEYVIANEPPAAFTRALSALNGEVAATLAEPQAAADAELLRFHFDALRFSQLLDSFGAHSQFDLTRVDIGPRGRHEVQPCVRNLVPAPFLAPRWRDAQAAVLFSATLEPFHYYADLLGLPVDTARLDVESPFRPEQLEVRIARRVSTRYADREASLVPIADLIARQFEARPGNYLAFFSSFQYLRQAHEALAARHPHIPTWAQATTMTEAERQAFVERFEAGGQGVGFAVLGGVFGEGIDLAGSRLIGAFIATLGLPQVNPVNEAMKQRMHALFGDGYSYAYLYPGLQKVVQAAGRVIRTPEDQGVVHLIDDRYLRRAVRELLPRWWSIGSA